VTTAIQRAVLAAFFAIAWSCQAPAVGTHYATVAWQPVKTYTNGQPIGSTVSYIVYKSSDGANFTVRAADIALTTNQFVDSSVLPNRKYWYYVTAYDSSVDKESAASNIAAVVIP
jgi:hypothetical protein